MRAYAELEKRHTIYSIPQSGYYVVEHADRREAGRESDMMDFSSSSPDSGLFPHADFQHCLNKAFDIYKHQLFTYGDITVLDNLRKSLVSHLANSQVFAKAEHIMVTTGVQHALAILAHMPFANGKAGILVEQPSYNHYLRYLEAEGLPIYGIVRTVNGLDLNELEETFRSGARRIL